jgi:hypothetical protein
MLENICANATRGPASFGDCHEALGIFYCGLIQDLKIKGLIKPTDDASPYVSWDAGFLRGCSRWTGWGKCGGHANGVDSI